MSTYVSLFFKGVTLLGDKIKKKRDELARTL